MGNGSFVVTGSTGWYACNIPPKMPYKICLSICSADITLHSSDFAFGANEIFFSP
jgi:hypothetical protein